MWRIPRVAEPDLLEGREPIHQTLRLRERAAARVLGEALTQMGADVTYAEAVQAAAELLVSRS